MPKKSNDNEEDDFAKNYLSSSDTDEMVIIPYIDELLNEKLPLVDEILGRETQSALEQQYGETIKPFGAVRMGATRFIANIIAVGSQDYALKLSVSLPSLLKYCVEYPWNTMLHNLVEQIFEEIFKANSKYKDDIRTALLEETWVTDFITDCATETEMKNSGRKIRTGLIATIINIANILNNHKSEYVQEELKKNEKWITFVDTELKYSNENNERALAGHQSKTGDSDDDSANYQTSMDKLFAAFTSLKESHDSSRELSDSDEEEEDQNTDNILEGIDSPEDKKEQTKEKASEEPENTESATQDKDVEETKESDENQETEKPKDTQEIKVSDEAQETENVKDPENTQGSEHSNKSEEVQDTPNTKNFEDTKVSNVSEPSSAIQHSKEASGASETTQTQPVSSNTPLDCQNSKSNDLEEEEKAEQKAKISSSKSLPVVNLEERLEEDASYYDASYWDVAPTFKLEDLDC